MVILASALFTSCATFKETQIPQTKCPLELTTDIPSEPKSPVNAGVNETAAIWIGTELLPWARENQRRLKAGQEWCKSHDN